ncbi:MAG: gluconokinase [Pyrinomonadaceae bacterium]
MSSVLDEVLEGFEPSPELVSVMAGSRTAAVLALDIGTSGVRASLFDQRGIEIEGASVRIEHRRSGLEDVAETDADANFELVAQTIDALLDKPFQSATQIQLIAVSCFWHSLLGVDATGLATTPVFGWADTRAASVVKDLRNRFDEAAVHARTGCRFHPSYWPAKLLSLRNEQPKIFNQTSRWLSFGEYVVLRLFGETAASVSMASGTGLFNQRSLEWDKELVEALEISSESLPEISSHGETFHPLTQEYAARWPQLSEARLLPPIGDGAANTIGSGCTTRERTALMIGTSGAMRVLYEGEPPTTLPAALWCYRADRRRVVVGGALSDGGGLYRWIRESLLPAEDSESIEIALETQEPDAHGLTVLPFWAGERSTGWSTEARGAILGLTMRTQPIEILRAALEAVAYRFALIARALEPFAPGASIIASGTALSLSPVWTQIIADVLGRAVVLAEAREASARGAALLALEAAGRIQSIAAFPERGEQTFEPNMSRHARYQEGLERQQKYYQSLFA